MTPTQRMVVLTRDEAGNQAWRSQLERSGLNVYELPCIQTASREVTPEIERTLTGIRDFHWIIFTSPTAVSYLLELMAELNLPLRMLTGAWIATTTQQTADALKSLGLVVNFVPSRETATTLAAELKRVKSRRILYLRTAPGSPRPVDTLRRRSATVTDLPVFQHLPVTTPDPGFNQLVRDGEISHLVFTTPAAVDGFTQRMDDAVVLELSRALPVLAIGPNVADSLEQAGFRTIHSADEPSVSAIAQLFLA